MKGRDHDFTLDEALEIAKRNDPGDKVPSVSRTLIAEIDRLRRDAERYRWLRDGKNQDEAFLYVMKDDPVTKYLTGDDVDAAIDAAMAGANT